MEVLVVVIGIAIIGFVGVWVLAISGVVLFVVYAIWPVVLGVVGGIALAMGGNDNLGVIFAIACFVGQYFWAQHTDDGSSPSDPMSGKIKTYNSDGKHTGYKDRE